MMWAAFASSPSALRYDENEIGFHIQTVGSLRMHRALLFAFIWLVTLLPPMSSAQKDAPSIQDNSFLVEEAYNQERGIVQHINTFTYFADSRDWFYTFTQEWPVPHDERQQLSYTL